jgi:hypothetical protein
VSGGGEGLRHEDVGAVVGDTHADVGTADEFADQNAEGAEDGWDAEPAGELQSASGDERQVGQMQPVGNRSMATG